MSRRTEKVAAEIVREISDIVANQLTDPRIGFVTFTDAEVSPDLSSARVYFTVLGDEKERKSTLAGLISARKFLRAELGRRLRLKRLPELTFVYDESVDYGMKIYDRLQQLKKEEDGEG